MINLLWLGLSIILIILLITRIKIHPALALVIGSVVLGLALRIPVIDLPGEIAGGFGELMADIGLSVGFGIILGQLLSDSGGARVIARTLVRLTSARFSMYGLAAAAFILSIPVFYDVTFVIIVPLAIPIAREANKPLPLAIGSVALGAGISHTLVPPTPNPLAAGEILGFGTGVMMIVGAIIGFIAMLATVALYSWILPKVWKPALDIEQEVSFKPESSSNRPAPGFLLSSLPIMVPIGLILLGTCWLLFEDEQPVWVQFLGDKTVALLLGAIVAYLVASKTLNKDERDDSANNAVQNAGVVLLVTGAGGAFGAIIMGGGIDDIIADAVQALGGNYILAMLVCYGVGVALRVAVGSGTVASITTMTIMTSVAPAVGIHPVWIAIACLAGALTLGHINDSGFWVTAKLPGFSVSGGLKTYTLAQSIAGVTVIILAIIGATLLPMSS